MATVGLLITTEDIDLHVAMSHIQLLRGALIDRFTAAGIPGASINAARCSSDPQFGVLRRNLNAHEVFTQLEVEACSVERPRLQGRGGWTQKACYEISLGIELRSVNFLYGNLQHRPHCMPFAPWNSPPEALGLQKLRPQMLVSPIYLMR